MIAHAWFASVDTNPPLNNYFEVLNSDHWWPIEEKRTLGSHRTGFLTTHDTIINVLGRGDTKKAEKQLSDCRKAAEDLLPLIKETPRLRMGAFSCSMEVGYSSCSASLEIRLRGWWKQIDGPKWRELRGPYGAVSQAGRRKAKSLLRHLLSHLLRCISGGIIYFPPCFLCRSKKGGAHGKKTGKSHSTSTFLAASVGADK